MAEDCAHRPGPLEPDFDIVAAARRIRAKTAVKTALLDQTVVSGIGNIYADEALWAAQVQPQRRLLHCGNVTL